MNKIRLTMDDFKKVIEKGLDKNNLLFEMSEEPIVEALVKRIDQELKINDLKSQMESVSDVARIGLELEINNIENDKTNGKTVNALYTALYNLTRVEFDAQMFAEGRYRVLSFDKNTPKGISKISSSNISEMMSRIVSVAPVIRSTVSNIISKIFDMLDVSSGYIFTSNDEAARDLIIEKFAENIDKQAGEGAFAAYMLYPDLYNKYTSQLGLKRHFLIGKKASTGKSIMGKLLITLYGPNVLATSRSYRPEASKSGYDADTISWNESVLGWPVVNIDDDISQDASQEDFLKNFYNEGYLKTGNGRIGYRYQTFDGFVSMNVNTYPKNITTPEISKRVYLIHLTSLATEYLTNDEISYLHSFNIIGDKSGLINYLNQNREKALDWLLNYTQPNISFETGNCNSELAEYIHNLMVESGLQRIPLREITNDFQEVRRGSDIATMTSGIYKVKHVKFNGVSTRCVIIDNMELYNHFVNSLQPLDEVETDVLVSDEYSNEEVFTIQKFQSVNDKVDLQKQTTHTMDGFVKELETIVTKENKKIETYGELPGETIINTSLEDLSNWKSNNVNKLSMISTVQYKQNGSANRDNIINNHFVMIDIDNTEVSLEVLECVLRDNTDLDYIIVSSLRDKEGSTKVHVWIPTSQPISDIDVYRATWEQLKRFFASFNIYIDEAVKDINRRVFTASSGRAFISRTSTGKGIVPNTSLALEKKASRKFFINSQDVNKTVSESIKKVQNTSEGNRNDTLNKELYKNKQLGASYEDLKAIADASPVTGNELLATFKSATNYDYK